jgi:hypothetical protein
LQTDACDEMILEKNVHTYKVGCNGHYYP